MTGTVFRDFNANGAFTFVVGSGVAPDASIVADASVDVAQARWAYFFGPGCEPGLAELERVVRRGGAAFVVDNDATRSTFGAWFRRGYPKVDPDAVERFWSRHGWQRERPDPRIELLLRQLRFQLRETAAPQRTLHGFVP